MSELASEVRILGGSASAIGGKVLVGLQPGIANAAGGGAGQAVTTAVTFPSSNPVVSPGGDLPASYTVVVNPGQDATWFVSSKTTTGFNVTLTPRLAANTLAAGTFDVAVFA